MGAKAAVDAIARPAGVLQPLNDGNHASARQAVEATAYALADLCRLMSFSGCALEDIARVSRTLARAGFKHQEWFASAGVGGGEGSYRWKGGKFGCSVGPMVRAGGGAAPAERAPGSLHVCRAGSPARGK